MEKNTKYSEYSDNFNDSDSGKSSKTNVGASKKSEFDDLLKDIESILENSILNDSDNSGTENTEIENGINDINGVEKNTGNSIENDEYGGKSEKEYYLCASYNSNKQL